MRPQAVARAVENLITNATRYGQTVEVRLEFQERILRVTVEDDGPGIPEAELEAVFAPFRRLETSRNRETGGTGLGLTIARNILRAHGGDVVLRNRAAGGLEATASLPT
jgi:signal transduction histidine kinase